VEFALVAPLAVAIALAVAQFALFLFERNVVMGSLSEGARVAAGSGRTVADGERAARNLLRESLGARIAVAVPVRGAVETGLVVLQADGRLPSFDPGVPGLQVHLSATMHKERPNAPNAPNAPGVPPTPAGRALDQGGAALDLGGGSVGPGLLTAGQAAEELSSAAESPAQRAR
jgi:hypothetical protein